MWAIEREIQGVRTIAGVDEVGRGCIAGPVYAAAVILPTDYHLPKLNDSKKLTPLQREKLYEPILQQSLSAQIAWVEVGEIDRINILKASLKAMAMALEKLEQAPDLVLVDGKFEISTNIPQKTLIQGDRRAASIAAASILAKVARDRFMAEQEEHYPGFSFAKHKGYGTALHLKELQTHGPTPLHRRSFAPVRDWTGSMAG